VNTTQNACTKSFKNLEIKNVTMLNVKTAHHQGLNNSLMYSIQNNVGIHKQSKCDIMLVLLILHT